MNIILNDAKSATLTKSAVKPYRNAPGDINKAIEAAFHYAKKNDEPMVCVPGNSYMNFVFHIAKESDSLTKYTGMAVEVKVAVVYPNGDVYLGKASK